MDHKILCGLHFVRDLKANIIHRSDIPPDGSRNSSDQHQQPAQEGMPLPAENLEAENRQIGQQVEVQAAQPNVASSSHPITRSNVEKIASPNTVQSVDSLPQFFIVVSKSDLPILQLPSSTSELIRELKEVIFLENVTILFL
jgi:hypothetical protein